MMYKLLTLGMTVWAITQKDFTLEVSRCGDSASGVAFLPDDYASVSYPVLSWAHGMDASVDEEFLSEFANFGYIVAATRGCAKGYVPGKESKDQIAVAEQILKTPEFNALNSVGFFGHSMGGQATIWSTTEDFSFDLKAAVAQMPALYTTKSSTPLVPTMFTAGSHDMLARAGGIHHWYKRTSGVDKVLLVGKDFGHVSYRKFAEPMTRFFDCYLKGDSASCDAIFTGLCDQPDSPYSRCETSKHVEGAAPVETEDSGVCKDSGSGLFQVPCKLAASMAFKFMDSCPYELEEACCESCNKHKSEQPQCVDVDDNCPAAAKLMFEKYTMCPAEVAGKCCASCAEKHLQAVSPTTKLSCGGRGRGGGWPFDIQRLGCEDMDAQQCPNLASQAKQLFGTCPGFLSTLCCASCKGDSGPSPSPFPFPPKGPSNGPGGKPKPPKPAPVVNPFAPKQQMCPPGRTWNECGSICPPECDMGNGVLIKCVSNFCVPQCDCPKGQFIDDNDKCTSDPCAMWREDGVDPAPFTPHDFPPFTPQPSPPKPVGPVHPENIPTHLPEPVNTDEPELPPEVPPTTIGDCTNEDSSRDSMGRTCSEWYDDHPEDCGRFNVRNHGFTAETQCCVCYSEYLLAKSKATEPEETPASMWDQLEGWQFAVGGGFLGGMILGLAALHVYRVQTDPKSLDFDILLDDAGHMSYHNQADFEHYSIRDHIDGEEFCVE